jgi:hypothetical protein
VGFDTVDKVRLLRAIADTAVNCRQGEVGGRCWITEMNWPLWEGPHSPAGRDVSVNEETQASYLVRYYLLVLAPAWSSASSGGSWWRDATAWSIPAKRREPAAAQASKPSARCSPNWPAADWRRSCQPRPQRASSASAAPTAATWWKPGAPPPAEPACRARQQGWSAATAASCREAMDYSVPVARRLVFGCE